MTELLDLLFGLLTPNLFCTDYSKTVAKAKVLDGSERDRVLDVFKNHMRLDPATASVVYDSILMKPIGKRHLKWVALKNNKKVFKYLSRNELEGCRKGFYLVICK
ncbi:MAG: hypothetical protein II817_01340 [Bacteroidales bacterium]|nr:hypothetical protein [Bacteroidales bacterium]